MLLVLFWLTDNLPNEPEMTAEPSDIRLARYIAMSGYCSRRQASRYIDAGEVSLNGRLAQHIDHVKAGDVVQLAGQLLSLITAFSYWLFNKPVGVDCNLRAHHSASLLHLLPPEAGRIYPVGRLDKDSHGLLLLTDDGDLCQRLIHPDFYHPKTYQVQVDRPFDEAFLTAMAAGVQLREGLTRPCQVQGLVPDRFEMVLTQGLNRQIRKMAQMLGYKVIDLQRVALANLTLDGLGAGEWRQLSAAEVEALQLSLTRD